MASDSVRVVGLNRATVKTGQWIPYLKLSAKPTFQWVEAFERAQGPGNRSTDRYHIRSVCEGGKSTGTIVEYRDELYFPRFWLAMELREQPLFDGLSEQVEFAKNLVENANRTVREVYSDQEKARLAAVKKATDESIRKQRGIQLAEDNFRRAGGRVSIYSKCMVGTVVTGTLLFIAASMRC